MIENNVSNDASVGPRASRRDLLAAMVGGSVAAVAGLPSLVEAATNMEGAFPDHPSWKFVFVNHVTTNPFFVPTQYGIADACALLGCSYQWVCAPVP